MTFKLIKLVPLATLFEMLQTMKNNMVISQFHVTKSRLSDIYRGFQRFQTVIQRESRTFVNPAGRFAAINASRYSESSLGRSTLAPSLRESKFDSRD